MSWDIALIHKHEGKATYAKRRLKRGVSARRGKPPPIRGIERLTLPSRQPRMDEVALWLEDAERDYTAAEKLSKHLDAKVHREILRLLHDSVEKSQKAVLRFLGRDFPRGPRGHDLVELSNLMRDKVTIPEKHKDIIEDLSLIYLRTRYLEEGSLPDRWYEDTYLLNYMGRVGELNSWLKTKTGLKTS